MEIEEKIRKYSNMVYIITYPILKNEDGTYTVYVVSYIHEIENANQSIKYAIEDGEIQEYYGSLISYIFGGTTQNGKKRYM